MKKRDIPSFPSSKIPMPGSCSSLFYKRKVWPWEIAVGDAEINIQLFRSRGTWASGVVPRHLCAKGSAQMETIERRMVNSILVDRNASATSWNEKFCYSGTWGRTTIMRRGRRYLLTRSIITNTLPSVSRSDSQVYRICSRRRRRGRDLTT